jgi:hypothetical protein
MSVVENTTNDDHARGNGRGIDERFAVYRRNGNRRLRDELVEEHVREPRRAGR